jgi:hypothetical protein
VRDELSACEDIGFFSASSSPFGQTYGQWTVNWWRWALSIPKSINPVLDPSGKFAHIGQPKRFVWFLTGRFGSEGANLPRRACTIPAGRAILFPIINYEANLLEYPQIRTEDELLKHVSDVEDTIARQDCFVDGIKIAAQRVKSDPEIFRLKISKDNAANIPNSGVTLAAADGYWVFLKALIEGSHVISFEGSCEQGKLKSGAFYNVRIKHCSISSS